MTDLKEAKRQLAIAQSEVWSLKSAADRAYTKLMSLRKCETTDPEYLEDVEAHVKRLYKRLRKQRGVVSDANDLVRKLSSE